MFLAGDGLFYATGRCCEDMGFNAAMPRLIMIPGDSRVGRLIPVDSETGNHHTRSFSSLVEAIKPMTSSPDLVGEYGSIEKTSTSSQDTVSSSLFL